MYVYVIGLMYFIDDKPMMYCTGVYTDENKNVGIEKTEIFFNDLKISHAKIEEDFEKCLLICRVQLHLATNQSLELKTIVNKM